MIFEASTKELSAALGVVGRVIPANSHITILRHVRVETNDTRIILTGSNLDMTLRAETPASVTTEGEACLPFATLREFVSRAKGEVVSVDLSGGDAVVKSGRGRISLMTASPADFPNPGRADGETVTVDGPSLCHALRFCSAAAATDEVRWNLCGVLFQEGDGGVTAWGTNGQVAHRAEIAGLAAIGGGGIIPNEAVQTILAICDKAETVDVMFGRYGWTVSAGGVTAWGKSIDGSFPDMAGMLARFAAWGEVIAAEHDDFAAGLDVAACGADLDSDKSRATILHCDAGGDAVVIRGLRPAGGASVAGRAEVAARVSGSMTAAFNARYLRSAMAGLKVARVAIRTCEAGGTRAIQIRPAQDDAVIAMEATITAMRVNEADLANV